MFCNECVKRQKCHLFWKNSDVILECSDFKKALTNADRIRAMSDEALMTFLNFYVPCLFCPMTDDCRGRLHIGEEGCKKQWLSWLRQEVSDEL